MQVPVAGIPMHYVAWPCCNVYATFQSISAPPAMNKRSPGWVTHPASCHWMILYSHSPRDCLVQYIVVEHATSPTNPWRAYQWIQDHYPNEYGPGLPARWTNQSAPRSHGGRSSFWLLSRYYFKRSLPYMSFQSLFIKHHGCKVYLNISRNLIIS